MRERSQREREQAAARAREQQAAPPPEAALLALQRSAGNQAVGALLRNKRAQPDADVAGYAYTQQAAVKTVQPPGNPAPAPVQWSLNRPTEVSGPFTGTAVPLRGATATPMAYSQTGNGAITTNRLLGYDGGHVIGLHLGGANISDNVVPMYPGFNRGVWKNLEDRLKAHANATPGPHRMRVALTYGAATAPEVPTTLTVTSESFAGGAWVQALPPQTLSQPADIQVTPQLPDDQADIVRPLAEDMTQNPLVGEMDGSAFILGENETFTAYVNRVGHLPPAQRALYPDRHADRPYEMLDVLVLNGRLIETTAKGGGTDFSAAQRELILQTNMARNGGQLRSDDPDDPHQVLDQRGTADAPEIDHIIPKSQGGSNLFSNARVVSWQLNNKEARVKPISGLVDTRRLPLPALGGGLIAHKARTIVEQALLRDTVNPITADAIAGWGAQAYNVEITPRLSASIHSQLAILVSEGSLVENAGVYTRA